MTTRAPLGAALLVVVAAISQEVGAALGVLSSVIPYSLELISLRRLPPSPF